jgi:hypothetical protein
MRTVVSLVEVRPETVRDDYRRALELADLPSRPDPSPCLLLTRAPAGGFLPGFGSPPWQLDAVLDYLGPATEQEAVARLLPVQDQGPVRSSSGDRKSVWPGLLEKRGGTLVPVAERELKPVRVERPLPALGAVLPDGFRAPSALNGAATLVLTTPVLDKTWQIGGSVALLGALLAGSARRPGKIPRSEVIAEALALAQETVSSLGSVMDAVAWGVFRQDGRAHPLLRNVVLAGRDPVAVDATAARLAGLDPRRIPWLQLCADRGLGVADREKIVIRGRKDLMDLDFHIPKGTFAHGPGGRSVLTAPGRFLGSLGRRGADNDFAASAWGRMLDGYRTGAME